MEPISLNELKRLLETDSLPGSGEQLRKLSVRITELTRLNGTRWIRENRIKLLHEWQTLVNKGLIR
jgi:hypothetical protein